MRTLTLSFVPESEDLAELLANSPTMRRARNRAWLNAGVSFLLALLFGATWIAYEPTAVTVILTFVCAGAAVDYGYKAVTSSTSRGLHREARKAWKRSPAMRQQREVTINDEGLTLRTEDATQIFAWKLYSEFVEYDRQFVLMKASGEFAVALAKRGLAEPSLVPVCRRLLGEFVGAAAADGSQTSAAD